jgi:outer membrane receptor protein involved in Fe transport
VSAEEFDRLPKGRSFQSIALTAPSVNQGEIEGGLQVNGASGAENSFTVDGVVTNSLVNGQSRQNTVFEYLQEVQVKTSGIAAEYGGALGGVISAVTKSGGNTFRGEAHYFFEGSGLAAGPVKRHVRIVRRAQ